MKRLWGVLLFRQETVIKTRGKYGEITSVEIKEDDVSVAF